MNQFYSKPTLIFLYVLHAIPAIYFIISIPSLLAACGLVECLWWQQIQIQLLPLLTVVIPFIAIYLQQKGKRYAGYFFVLSLIYYLIAGSSINFNFIFTLFLITIISTQGYLLFKTTRTFLTKTPKKKSKKEVSPYKDILTIAGIVILFLIVLRLFFYTPIPSSETDCATITDQEKADTCYLTLASSSADFDFCTKVQSPSQRDECYSYSGAAEHCAKITVNQEAMMMCLNYNFLWQTADQDYCDTTANPGLCNFGLAIRRENLDLCVDAENRETCETIVKSSKNLCLPSIQTGPTYYEYDVGGVCDLYDPYQSWSYARPAKETLEINPAECQKIAFSPEQEERVSWSDIYRDQCFTASAVHYKDKNICNSISDKHGRWLCVIIAAATSDDCNEIPPNEKIPTGDHYSIVRDECFLSLALRTGDLNLCLQDSDQHEAAWCINDVVSRYGVNPAQCAAIPEGSAVLGFGDKRSACYNGLAHFKNDPEPCSFIPVSYVRAECIGSIGTIKDCDAIPKDEKTEDGQSYVRDSCITAIINKNPNVDSCNYSASKEGFNWCVDLTARITGNQEVCSVIEDQQLREMCVEQAIIAASNQ